MCDCTNINSRPTLSTHVEVNWNAHVFFSSLLDYVTVPVVYDKYFKMAPGCG
jgi:hypothetical protein